MFTVKNKTGKSKKTHYSIDYINRNDSETVDVALGDYYNFSLIFDEPLGLAFCDEEYISIEARKKKILPQTKTWDTQDIVYCLGILIEPECGEKHKHTHDCKPTIMCCPCIMDELLESGTMSQFDRRRRAVLIGCCTPACPAYVCSRCFDEKKMGKKSCIDPKKWKCPLCTSRAFPWPTQLKDSSDVEKYYKENPYKIFDYDDDKAREQIYTKFIQSNFSEKKEEYDESIYDRDDLEDYDIIDIGKLMEEDENETSDEKNDGQTTPTMPATPEPEPLTEEDMIHVQLQPEKKTVEKKESKQIEHKRRCHKCYITGNKIRWRKWPHVVWGSYPFVCSECYDKEVNSRIIGDIGKRRLRSGKTYEKKEKKVKH